MKCVDVLDLLNDKDLVANTPVVGLYSGSLIALLLGAFIVILIIL